MLDFFFEKVAMFIIVAGMPTYTFLFSLTKTMSGQTPGQLVAVLMS